MANTKIAATLAALMLTSAPIAYAQTAPDNQLKTGAISNSAGQNNYLDQREVEDLLEDRDFSDIDVELRDDEYRGEADWYGETVDVRVDARSGRVEKPDRLSSDQVKNKLEDDGYEDVSEVRRAGDEYTATAKRFGEDMDLRVSATRGNIIDPRELKADQVKELLEDDEDYSEVTVFERDEDYGSFFATGEKDDDTYLIEVNPISGKIENERETS